MFLFAGREPSSDSTEGEEAEDRGRKNASKLKTKKRSKFNVTKYLIKQMNYQLRCFFRSWTEQRLNWRRRDWSSRPEKCLQTTEKKKKVS